MGAGTRLWLKRDGSPLRAISGCVHICTFATVSGSLGDNDIRVFSGELVTMDAVRLPGVYGRWSEPAAHIFAICNGLKMIWIYARSITAQVVDGRPFRDRPTKECVCEPVSRFESSEVVAGPEQTVSLLGDVTAPRPAPFRVRAVREIVEPLQRHNDILHQGVRDD